MPSGLKLKNQILNNTSKIIFLAVTAGVLVFFLVVSNRLVNQLSVQEKERMDIWARATERLVNAQAEEDVEFLLSIIRENNFIPVLVADSAFMIVDYRNFSLPEKEKSDNLPYERLSKKNRDFLKNRLIKATGNRSLEDAARTNPHFIKVELFYNNPQYIYYEDSRLLKRLSWYPYVEIAILILLALIIYGALVYAKNAERDHLWAGLSKETAHQLGTPISSLAAWTQYLETNPDNCLVAEELGKDVKRLSTIARRFSKVGSKPETAMESIYPILERSLSYMRNRVSEKIRINLQTSGMDLKAKVSEPLLEWVIENLTKNAVDAMGGEGEIDVSAGKDKGMVWIEVRDTGKGIPGKNHKKIFRPGFTTKKRGWGLGLTLAKRIVEEYHGGRIFVKKSDPSHGTTFRIEIPS